MAGLAEYMRGLVDGGPTRSGHRTPAVIVEAPVNGTDEANVRYNAWQFRQILGRGVHGILLCQAETADAVRAFVESCRYPHQRRASTRRCPSPLERHARRACAGRSRRARGLLGVGTRGRGSESTAAADLGPLRGGISASAATRGRSTRDGELLLGVKLESPEGVAQLRGDPGRAGHRLCRDGTGRSRPVARLRRDAARSVTRRRCARRASASSPPAARNGVAFLESAHARQHRGARSTRACGSSPATARTPPASAAPTSAAPMPV